MILCGRLIVCVCGTLLCVSDALWSARHCHVSVSFVRLFVRGLPGWTHVWIQLSDNAWRVCQCVLRQQHRPRSNVKPSITTVEYTFTHSDNNLSNDQ